MASGLIQQIKIDTNEYNIASTAFGVCSSNADNPLKTVSIPGFALTLGTTIHVQFSNNNTASSPTLNVNGTGALFIDLPNRTSSGTIDESTGWPAGAVLSLTYNGTSWIRNHGYNTNNKVSQINTSYNYSYPVIFKYSANTSNEVDQVRYTENVNINPFTGILSATAFSGSGENLTNIPYSALTIPDESIPNSKLVNSSITVANRIWDLGDEISADTLREDLGLSKAMRFIGVVASNSQHTPSDGQNEIPTISGISGYIPSEGDVVIDSAISREYVYTSAGSWELLGQDASTTLDSNLFYYSSEALDEASLDQTHPVTPTSLNNIWISRIQQLSDRTLVLHKTTLNTSGTWTGNAATATSWATAQTTYVNLASSGIDSTLNGGQNNAQVLKVDGILGIANGGTNTSITPTIGGLIYAGGTTGYEAYASTGAGSQGQVIISNGSNAPEWYAGLTLTSTIENSTTVYDATFNGTITVINDASIGGDLSVTGETELLNDLTITGDITPSVTNTYSLGSPNSSNLIDNANRWKALFIGTADAYGDAYQPVYWNDGVPALTYPVQYFTWTISNGNLGVQLTHESFTEDTFPLTVMIISGEENLNGPISWTNGNGTFKLQSTQNTSGNISGYCIVSRGTPINPTSTQIVPLST